MKCILFLILLCSAVPSLQAQQTELITNSDGRKTVKLDGQWQTIIDPYETGYYDYRYLPSADGYFKDAKPKSKSDLIEYDFDTSESLSVPGDWNTQKERLLLYEGTIWYKKSFDYQKATSTRLFVYFGAANYVADVYLNGEKLGRHEGGFTPFNFEITNLVRQTANSLIVKVDNKRRRDGVPTLNTDWWNYGGLTREVRLIETPATFVQDYFIQLQQGSREYISGWVKLSASGKDAEKNLFPAWNVSLDSDGLPFSTPTATRHSRLPQPKGFDFRPWRAEEGVLHNAAVLSRDRSLMAEVAAVA